jgi:hypothetical protein
MSVVRCFLQRQGTKLSIDQWGRATVTRQYLVECTDAADGEYTVAVQSTSALPDPIPHIINNVLDQPLLAQYNLDHGAGELGNPTDPCAWLTKKDIEPILSNDETGTGAGGFFWKVTCTWTPLPLNIVVGTGSGTGAANLLFPRYNPLEDPVIERSEYEHFRRKADFDVNGSAIANSAGDPIGDVIVDDQRPVLVFTKNVWPASTVDDLSAKYKNAINPDTFRGHLPYTLKICSITKGPVQERNGVQFVPMIAKMYKAEVESGSYGTSQTWMVTRADIGVHYLEDGVKKVPTVLSGTGQGDPLDFVNLDTDGSRLPDGTPPKSKTFQVYPAVPFSGLGLG